VRKYLPRYGLVLVTNYRDFILLGHDALGNPLPMEGVLAAGYKTKSRDFRGVVNNMLLSDKRFKKVARGEFTLKQ
jgi:hypothetical protein